MKKFADATNKKVGEFCTPRSVVRPMVNILDSVHEPSNSFSNRPIVENEIWFDPDPLARTSPVPGNRIEHMTEGIPRLTWATTPLGNYAVEARDTLTEPWRALVETHGLACRPGTVSVEDPSPVLPWERYNRVRLRP